MVRLNSMVTIACLAFAHACTSDRDERADTADSLVSADETEEAADSSMADISMEEVLQIPDTGPCLGASVGAACAPSGKVCGTYDECCCGLCTPSQTCMCENGRFVCGSYADRCLRPECAEK